FFYESSLIVLATWVDFFFIAKRMLMLEKSRLKSSMVNQCFRANPVCAYPCIDGHCKSNPTTVNPLGGLTHLQLPIRSSFL
ncbi:MAG: hypothetical protein ACTSWD_12410, partial [Candidatus Heimdallarchaeota archaeon]